MACWSAKAMMAGRFVCQLVVISGYMLVTVVVANFFTMLLQR